MIHPPTKTQTDTQQSPEFLERAYWPSLFSVLLSRASQTHTNTHTHTFWIQQTEETKFQCLKGCDHSKYHVCFTVHYVNMYSCLELFHFSCPPLRITSPLASKSCPISQAEHFDEPEHTSYADVSCGKGSTPAEQPGSQEQYRALSVRAWDSAAANISLTWPCTEPCVFSITSRCAAFMDCRDCVLKWTQQCTTGRTASFVICPNKYAEWKAGSLFPVMTCRPSDQTSWKKHRLCT